MISHLEGLGIRVHNTAEMKAFLEKNGVEDIEQYIKDQKEMEAIKQKAIADGTFMKAPNGKPTNLTERQWLQVRTTNFKNWFGDWENYYKKKFLLFGKVVSLLTGNEFAKVEGKTLQEQVVDFYNTFGNVAVSSIYGDVLLDKKGIDDSFAHGIGRNKAIAYAAVKEVIEHGIVVDYHANHKGRGYNTAIVAAPIQIGNERYICQVAIRRNKDGNQFYLHEVTAQKNLPSDAFVTNLAQKPAPKGDFAKILQNIMSASDNVSKVVDNNGEPKVMYHGTDGDFNIFSFDYFGRTDPGDRGRGFYFGDKEIAECYGPIVMQVFLNIKEPYNRYGGFEKRLGKNLSKKDIEEEITDSYKKRIEDSTKHALQALKDRTYNMGMVYAGIVSEDGKYILTDEKSIRKAFEKYYGKQLSKKINVIGNIETADGFISDYEKVVYTPNQIKSATANNGDFSLTNNDIEAFVDRYDLPEGEFPLLYSALIIKYGNKTAYGDVICTADYEYTVNYKGAGEFDIIEYHQIDNNIKNDYYDRKNKDFSEYADERAIQDEVARRKYNSDSYNIEDGEANGNNAGLDIQASQRESEQTEDNVSGQQHQEWRSVKRDSATGRIAFVKGDGRTNNSVENLKDIETFATPQGEIYGFVDADGEVYFDKDAKGFSSEHVVHEYTHLWDRVIQKKNPKFWARGVYLMQNGASSLWNEIANSPQYGQKWINMGLSGTELENKIASEVHARLSGEKGKEVIEKIEKEQGSSGDIKYFVGTLKAVENLSGRRCPQTTDAFLTEGGLLFQKISAASVYWGCRAGRHAVLSFSGQQ